MLSVVAALWPIKLFICPILQIFLGFEVSLGRDQFVKLYQGILTCKNSLEKNNSLESSPKLYTQ